MKKLCFYSCVLSLFISSGLVFAEPSKGKGKELKAPQMKLLNLKMEAIAVVRTKVTSDKAERVIQEIEALQNACSAIATPGSEKQKTFVSDAAEQAFIAERLNLMLEPIKKFFEIVCSYKKYIIPIVAESLGITEKDLAKSWFLRFFATKEDAMAFFEREVKTLGDLKTLSKEFITVFDDLYTNLSPKLRNECEEICKAIKAQAAQKN